MKSLIFALSIPFCVMIAGKRDRIGVLIQAIFRSGYSLIGIPLAGALYGEETGGDITLAGQLVVWSTLISAFTVFMFTLLIRMGGAF